MQDPKGTYNAEVKVWNGYLLFASFMLTSSNIQNTVDKKSGE